jgi:hypothetical protein
MPVPGRVPGGETDDQRGDGKDTGSPGRPPAWQKEPPAT